MPRSPRSGRIPDAGEAVPTPLKHLGHGENAGEVTLHGASSSTLLVSRSPDPSGLGAPTCPPAVGTMSIHRGGRASGRSKGDLLVRCMYNRAMVGARDPGPKSQKSGRLGLRTNDWQRAILAAASRAEGSSVSEFVLKHATRAAEDVLAERRGFLLSESQWTAFVDILDRPPRDLLRLRSLLEEPTVFDEPR